MAGACPCYSSTFLEIRRLEIMAEEFVRKDVFDVRMDRMEALLEKKKRLPK